MDPQARVRALYSVMQSIENKLGGGEGVEGLYGSINKGGMQKVVDALTAKCGLDANSRLVDIGAGLGRPLMHALVEPGIASGFGVEIDRIKCDKAAAFLRQTVAELARRGVSSCELEAPVVQCSSIEQIKTLDPCTHAYSFWEGVPYDGKMAFGRLFAGSRTLRSVAVVQRAMRKQDPAEVMEELGFGKLVLADSFSVSMSGSGRSFTAYVFNRVDEPVALPAVLAAEQALAEEVATPTLSQEPLPACATAAPADSAPLGEQQPEGEGEGEQADAAAAVASSGAEVEAPPPQQPAAQPALGRGARRAVRSRRAAEAAAAEEEPSPSVRSTRSGRAAAAAEPLPAAAAAAGEAGSKPPAGGATRKGASPQKPRGVQKKTSPKKQVAALLLQDAHVRRPRSLATAAAAGAKGKGHSAGGKEALVEDAVLAEAPQPPVRRGLLV